MAAWAWGLVLASAGALQGAALAWPLQGADALSWLPWPAFGQPVPWLQWLAMCVWVWAVQTAPTVGSAARRSWLFSTAWLCATFWWLSISMTVFGGLPMVLAAMAVGLLAGALALYYALAAALMWRWRAAGPWVQAAVVGAVWLLAEWARGRLLTGFPWGAVGYAQVDAWGLLAPWVGVYGMSALSAALAAWAVKRWHTANRRRGASQRSVWGVWPALVLLPWMLWPGGSASLMPLLPGFTQSSGPLPVLLLQGNVNQREKFDPETGLRQALDWYGDAIVQGVADMKSREGLSLIVAPETAVPVLPGDVDAAWWSRIERSLGAGRSALMMGLPMGSWTEGYTNSVMAWSPSGQSYRYDKHHLVPFGEFVPPGFRWFVEAMRIPMTDFERGPLGAQPLFWAGQRLSPNICYEDLFGEELAVLFKDPAHAPTVLVNVSNIAWFGNTVALDQHRHIARMRALELERPMIRATNTGSTVAIDHQGRVLAEAPRWEAAVLEAMVDGRQGLTPYARWVAAWGLWPLVGLALLLLAVLWWRTR